jgi:hypothetical protein
MLARRVRYREFVTRRSPTAATIEQRAPRE